MHHLDIFEGNIAILLLLISLIDSHVASIAPSFYGIYKYISELKVCFTSIKKIGYVNFSKPIKSLAKLSPSIVICQCCQHTYFSLTDINMFITRLL